MRDALFHLAFPTHDVAAAKRFKSKDLVVRWVVNRAEPFCSDSQGINS